MERALLEKMGFGMVSKNTTPALTDGLSRCDITSFVKSCENVQNDAFEVDEGMNVNGIRH